MNAARRASSSARGCGRIRHARAVRLRGSRSARRSSLPDRTSPPADRTVTVIERLFESPDARPSEQARRGQPVVAVPRTDVTASAQVSAASDVAEGVGRLAVLAGVVAVANYDSTAGLYWFCPATRTSTRPPRERHCGSPAARGGSRSCGIRPAQGSSCAPRPSRPLRRGATTRGISRRQSRPVASSSTSSAPPSWIKPAPRGFCSISTRRRSMFRLVIDLLDGDRIGGSRTTPGESTWTPCHAQTSKASADENAMARPCSARSRPRSSVRATSGRSETIASPSSAHDVSALLARARAARRSPSRSAATRGRLAPYSRSPEDVAHRRQGRGVRVSNCPGCIACSGFSRRKANGGSTRACAPARPSPRPASRRPGRHRSLRSSRPVQRFAEQARVAPRRSRTVSGSSHFASSSDVGATRASAATWRSRGQDGARPHPRTRRRPGPLRSESHRGGRAGPTSRGPPRAASRHASRGRGVPHRGGRGRAARRGRSTLGWLVCPMSGRAPWPRIDARRRLGCKGWGRDEARRPGTRPTPPSAVPCPRQPDTTRLIAPSRLAVDPQARSKRPSPSNASPWFVADAIGDRQPFFCRRCPSAISRSPGAMRAS